MGKEEMILAVLALAPVAGLCPRDPAAPECIVSPPDHRGPPTGLYASNTECNETLRAGVEYSWTKFDVEWCPECGCDSLTVAGSPMDRMCGEVSWGLHFEGDYDLDCDNAGCHFSVAPVSDVDRALTFRSDGEIEEGGFRVCEVLTESPSPSPSSSPSSSPSPSPSLSPSPSPSEAPTSSPTSSVFAPVSTADTTEAPTASPTAQRVQKHDSTDDDDDDSDGSVVAGWLVFIIVLASVGVLFSLCYAGSMYGYGYSTYPQVVVVDRRQVAAQGRKREKANSSTTRISQLAF